MKDLGPAKRILGMHIYKDRNRGVLITFSQEGYLNKVLDFSGTQQANVVNMPIGAYFKLTLMREQEAGVEAICIY